jgi:hypothetical protein
MRRRRVEAYRVIDEEELLATGAFAGQSEPLSDSVSQAGRARPSHGLRGLRAGSRWGSTLAAIVGLAGVAAALLLTSAHAPASPSSPRRVTAAKHSKQDAAVAALVTANPWPPRARPSLNRSSRDLRTPRRRLARRRPSPPRTQLHVRAARRRHANHHRQTRADALRARRRSVATAAVQTLAPTAPRVAATQASDAAAGPAAEFGFER